MSNSSARASCYTPRARCNGRPRVGENEGRGEETPIEQSGFSVYESPLRTLDIRARARVYADPGG